MEDTDASDDAFQLDETSPIVQSFKVFQKELDTKHDKYERLVKLGRDVTIESKRIIFLLHRIKKNDESRLETVEEAGKRLKDLEKSLLRNITKELVSEDPFQYIRAFSPGIQEFVEAITFFHYEKTKDLLPLDTILSEVEGNVLESELSDKKDENSVADCVSVHLVQHIIQPSDYILGIADLTGELMRKCIMSIGAGQMQMPFELCKFLRQVHDGFVSIGNQGPREVSRKMFTLKQSLNKVETACYTLQVRGSEIPKHSLVDVFTCSRNYSAEQEILDE